jgi:hypothetical protein
MNHIMKDLFLSLVLHFTIILMVLFLNLDFDQNLNDISNRKFVSVEITQDPFIKIDNIKNSKKKYDLIPNHNNLLIKPNQLINLKKPLNVINQSTEIGLIPRKNKFLIKTDQVIVTNLKKSDLSIKKQLNINKITKLGDEKLKFSAIKTNFNFNNSKKTLLKKSILRQKTCVVNLNKKNANQFNRKNNITYTNKNRIRINDLLGRNITYTNKNQIRINDLLGRNIHHQKLVIKQNISINQLLNLKTNQARTSFCQD